MIVTIDYNRIINRHVTIIISHRREAREVKIKAVREKKGKKNVQRKGRNLGRKATDRTDTS